MNVRKKESFRYIFQNLADVDSPEKRDKPIKHVVV